MNVAILGASNDPERYSYKAVVRLKEAGHNVLPVHPKLTSIEGIPVFASLSKISVPVDTLTLYVSPEISSKLASEIFSVQPKRIIFNPGAENREFVAKAEAQGIEVQEACTLVMLGTGQY